MPTLDRTTEAIHQVNLEADREPIRDGCHAYIWAIDCHSSRDLNKSAAGHQTVKDFCKLHLDRMRTDEAEGISPPDLQHNDDN